MKQTDLISLIAKDTGFRYEVVRKVLRKLTKYACVAFEADDSIRIGLGEFTLKEHGPKPVQNFITGKRFFIGPRKKILFTPSNYVKLSIKKTNLKLQADYEAQQEQNAQ